MFPKRTAILEMEELSMMEYKHTCALCPNIWLSNRAGPESVRLFPFTTQMALAYQSFSNSQFQAEYCRFEVLFQRVSLGYTEMAAGGGINCQCE
jgi:hypothetical protein